MCQASAAAEAAARRGAQTCAPPRPGHTPRCAGQRRKVRCTAAQQDGLQELPENGHVKEAVWPRLAAALEAARRRRPRGAPQHAPQAAAPRRRPCFPRRGACVPNGRCQQARKRLASSSFWPSAPARLTGECSASVRAARHVRAARSGGAPSLAGHGMPPGLDTARCERRRPLLLCAASRPYASSSPDTLRSSRGSSIEREGASFGPTLPPAVALHV